MDNFTEILKQCPLFDQIEEKHYGTLLRCFGARTLKVRKNGIVFHEGDPATGVGVVLSGSVQIVQEDYLGNRSIVSMAAPGQLFAEGFACARVEALPVSVLAAVDSEVMIIECAHILTLCHNACSFHNQMVRNLLHSVAHGNLRLNQKIEILSKRTTREKVMAYLLTEAKLVGNDEFDIPYDRQELADFLGVERSAMSTVIGKLQDDGLIEVKRRHFKIIC